MLELKNKTTITIILLLSIVILLIAFFIQYILGHAPCNLCLIERIPYLLVIIIIPVGLFNKKFEKALKLESMKKLGEATVLLEYNVKR